jgi:hypothetical protein
MAGYGGNVWWSDAVTRMVAVKGGNLKTSVAFSGGCSTWDGVLKPNQYGQAKITKRGGGKPGTVQRGWIMLGAAVPVKVQDSVD